MAGKLTADEFERLTRGWTRDPVSGHVVFFRLRSVETAWLRDDTVILHLEWSRDDAHLAEIDAGESRPVSMQFIVDPGLVESIATKLRNVRLPKNKRVALANNQN